MRAPASSTVLPSTSNGSSTKTGPGRPLSAVRIALVRISGMRAASATWTLHLVIGRSRSTCEVYVDAALAGILSLREDAVYQRLFAEGVRMRFYGDYRRIFARPPFRDWLDACDRIPASAAWT